MALAGFELAISHAKTQHSARWPKQALEVGL